jgi:hypothetical protein
MRTRVCPGVSKAHHRRSDKARFFAVQAWTGHVALLARLVFRVNCRIMELYGLAALLVFDPGCSSDLASFIGEAAR